MTAIVTGSTDNTGYYKNEGTAENIQIELRDDQDAALKNGDSKTVIVDEITRNAQFPLKARAITVNGNARPGNNRGANQCNLHLAITSIRFS